MKKIRRIPTILGVLFLLAGVGASLLLLQRGTGWFLKASPEIAPKQVSVTNVTSDSFTVSWLTDEKSSGLIKYGPGGSLTLTASEEGGEVSGTVHHVTIKNLQPATLYQFKIISDGKLFDNEGKPFEASTAPELKASIPPSDVAYGKVVDKSGQPVARAIVYLNLANVSPLSAQTKSTGSWMVPLNLARSTDLATFAVYDKGASVEEILVLSELGNATLITTTGQDSPVPDIVLGQNLDLRLASQEQDLSKTTIDTQNQMPTPDLPESDTEAAEEEEFSILTPEEDESLATFEPLFVGEGPSGKELLITVESENAQTATIVPDENGQWQWSPPVPLEPGEHTVTVSYTDSHGQKQTLKRTFLVMAAGDDSLPALSSSPSGEMVASTPALSPTPEASPTGRISLPSTESGVPASGQLTPTLVVFVLGAGLILLGFLANRRPDLYRR